LSTITPASQMRRSASFFAIAAGTPARTLPSSRNSSRSTLSLRPSRLVSASSIRHSPSSAEATTFCGSGFTSRPFAAAWPTSGATVRSSETMPRWFFQAMHGH
jgi:hypothetical protein